MKVSLIHFRTSAVFLGVCYVMCVLQWVRVSGSGSSTGAAEGYFYCSHGSHFGHTYNVKAKFTCMQTLIQIGQTSIRLDVVLSQSGENRLPSGKFVWKCLELFLIGCGRIDGLLCAAVTERHNIFLKKTSLVILQVCFITNLQMCTSMFISKSISFPLKLSASIFGNVVLVDVKIIL